MERLTDQEIHVPYETLLKAMEDYLSRHYFKAPVCVKSVEKHDSGGYYIATVDINPEPEIRHFNAEEDMGRDVPVLTAEPPAPGAVDTPSPT